MLARLSRRTFGALLLALGSYSLSTPGLAKEPGYAQPELLMEPARLREVIELADERHPEYDAEGIVLVDVRPRADFEEGHIPGARSLDPNAVVAKHSPIDGTLRPLPELEAVIGDLGISADRKVVLYDDRGGFHAARMFWLLEYLGHRKVALLNGGLKAWTGSGGTSAAGAGVKPASVVFQSAPSPRRYASADDVLSYRNDPDSVLIDVRPPKMYADGHIPWAVNIPWARNIAEDGRFMPAGELIAHFKEQGVTPESNVIMHCQVGLASAHSYVALRLLGFPRVRVYHRSWAEWGGDAALPKSF